MGRFTHANYYTGEPCNCGFGRPAPKPDWEFTASKIEWLRKREDLQTPEAQEFLDNLENRYPSADKLFPMLVKHWKQDQKLQREDDKLSEIHQDYNRSTGQLHEHQKQLADRLNKLRSTPDGRHVIIGDNGKIAVHQDGYPHTSIYGGQLDEMLSNMEKLKAHGRGVNLDSFTLPQFIEHMENEGKWLDARERRNLGQPMHQFDNGWSIKRLQNAHECIKEGKDMHHCTGNPTQPEAGHSHYKGMSYQEGVHPNPDESKYHLYSLRDENNFPHATFETLYPIGSSHNEVVQLYGPHDQPGPEEHRQMVNEFLNQHGMGADWGSNYEEQCENCGNEVYEDDLCYDCWHERYDTCTNCGNDGVYQDNLCESCYEKENFEPWWEEQYYTEPASDVNSYVDQFHNGETEEYADPEWERAWHDADHYEHEPPSLVPSDPDFESVWSDLANPSAQSRWHDPMAHPVRRDDDQQKLDYATPSAIHRQFNPEQHQDLLDVARDEGHLRDFYHAYHEWLENEYEGAPEWPYEDDVANFYGDAFQEHINPETGAFENPKRVWQRRDPNDPDGGQRLVWQTARDRYWQSQAPNYPQIEGLEQADTFNEGYYNSEPQQVPARPSYWSKAAKRRTHYHWEHGHPCGCPWGEHQGWTAARIDHLRGRPDLQDEDAQGFLKHLEEKGYPDKLLNWIVREWKKDRLAMVGGRLFSTSEGYHPFTPARALEWEKTLNEAKRLGNGIDLMQHDYDALKQKMEEEAQAQSERERPNLGQVVHQFDNGWTMRKLRNAREAQIEGDEMNHCVGSYGKGIESGENHIYSLRDPDNHPHATVQLNKDHPDATSIHQAYGRNDHPITDDDHREMVANWLDSTPNLHGAQLDPWTHGEEGDEGQQWWDDVYTVPVETPEDYVYHNHPTGGSMLTYDDAWESLPEEYRQAVSEADEYGLDQPDLEPTAPDWDSIIGDLTNPIAHPNYPKGKEFENWRYLHDDMFETLKYNPEHFQEFYDAWNRWKSGEPVRTGPHRYSPVADPYEESDPYHRSLNDYWQQAFGQAYNPETGTFRSPGFGSGRTWWDQNYENYPQLPGLEWQDPENEITKRWPADHRTNQPIPSYMRMGAAPLYYRWTFSPDTGEVEVGHNDEDHPALVRYHEQLADKLNRADVINGYAYRITDGWRLSDDEHKPLEDPYIVSQVLRALNRGPQPTGPDWTPEHEDFDRLHYGLPAQAPN